MIATNTVAWKNFILYYPTAKDTDKSEVLRSIAIAAAEIMGKWDIFVCDFEDDAQCGVTEYEFAELKDKGFFVQDIVAVSVGDQCLTRDNEHCGMNSYSFSVSHDCTKITINPPPPKDCPGAIKVTAKMGINLMKICELPEKFFLKYAVHIANYAIYKSEIQKRGESNQTSRALVDRLYRDAVEFFEDNEWNPMRGQVFEAGTSSGVSFQSCCNK